jgi:hypothetical protein
MKEKGGKTQWTMNKPETCRPNRPNDKSSWCCSSYWWLLLRRRPSLLGGDMFFFGRWLIPPRHFCGYCVVCSWHMWGDSKWTAEAYGMRHSSSVQCAFRNFASVANMPSYLFMSINCFVGYDLWLTIGSALNKLQNRLPWIMCKWSH